MLGALWSKQTDLTLPDQSIRNPKRKCIANEDRKSAADSRKNSFPPRSVPQRSGEQGEGERNPELTENDVPRSKRNHSSTALLPPMNLARHLFVERNIDCAKQSDHQQPSLGEPFPQSQSDVSELHGYHLPGERHPKRRSPDHWATANRVTQRARIIDQPRVSRKLGKSHYDSEKEKTPKQRVPPNERKADK